MAAKTVMTPIGTLCFADQVFTPKSLDQGKTPRYSAMLLFDSTGVSTTAYAELRKLIQDAAAENAVGRSRPSAESSSTSTTYTVMYSAQKPATEITAIRNTIRDG